MRSLHKRLAPTDQGRKAEVIKLYNSLKVYNKDQTVERFLYEWVRIYGLAVSLNLPDVTEERPLYDFALALHDIDKTYAINLELRVDENVRQRSTNNTIKQIQLEDAIEEFRNYFNRYQEIYRKIIPASFASTNNNARPDQRKFLCGDTHLFKECYYLNPGLRPSSWVGKESTFRQINNALNDPKRVKIKTLIQRTTEDDGEKRGSEEIKDQKSLCKKPLANFIVNEDEIEELQNSYTKFSTNFASLAATDTIESLKDSWILDGGSDVHICNDADKWGFIKFKNAKGDDVVRAEKSAIPIEAYGTVKIKVDTPK